MGLDWMDLVRAGALSEADEDGGAARPEADTLLGGLNEAQRQAVTHPGGPLLILAGAGTGKTRAITHRVAWLVATGAARPHEILGVTFTNKAAREMRGRIGALLGRDAPWIGTFHSICARFLRREIGVLEGRSGDFSIHDTSDRNQLLKRLTKDLGYDPTRFRPGQVGAWISRRKNLRHSPTAAADETHAADVDEVHGAADVEGEALHRIERAYLAAMRAQNALDFDDLLLCTLEVFEAEPGLAEAWSASFRHVLVDEYQDTNRVQYLLTRHFARVHGNLAVCGDPDQSIYAWRGADIGNILAFERDFPGAAVVKLEENYRSSGNILAAAQALIAHNTERREKDLWTRSDAGDPIGLIEAEDENDEADAIADRIGRLRAAGRRLDEVAVLYRVHFQQRALERGLRMAGVAYRIAGGLEFYQRREIKDLVAYLIVLSNPADDVALERIVNVPLRGIGERSLEVLRGWARERGVSLSHAVRSADARAAVRGRARGGLEAFAQLLEQLEHLPGLKPAEALEQVIAAVDYLDWLDEGDDTETATRQDNVEELVAAARQFEERSPEGSLRGFLEEVALVSDVDGLDAGGESGEAGAVTLMTLHAAKGLEFPFVFVTGLEEGLLPHARALGDGDEADDSRGLEEERRLFYVGLTRARERLWLSSARTRRHWGESTWSEASRFLDELPADRLDGDAPVPGDPAEEERALGAYDGEQTHDLAEGDRVLHGQFGYGRLVRLQGAGANARATVHFDGQGAKILLLQYAKLTRVGAAR